MWPHLAALQPALVALHVASAVAALAIGPLVLAGRKGDRTHRRLGRAYVSLMLAACASAAALLLWRFNPFLAGVTALSLYTVVTATRAAVGRRRARPTLDRSIAVLGLASGGALVAFAIGAGAGWWPGGPAVPAERGLVAALGLAFGGTLLTMGASDVRRLAGPEAPSAWLDLHIARILGSYIALGTAFAVQAAPTILPGGWQWLAWIAPGLLGGRVWAPRYARRERQALRTAVLDRPALLDRPAVVGRTAMPDRPAAGA